LVSLYDELAPGYTEDVPDEIVWNGKTSFESSQFVNGGQIGSDFNNLVSGSIVGSSVVVDTAPTALQHPTNPFSTS
jgi:hypothetical protein